MNFGRQKSWILRAFKVGGSLHSVKLFGVCVGPVFSGRSDCVALENTRYCVVLQLASRNAYSIFVDKTTHVLGWVIQINSRFISSWSSNRCLLR